MAKEFEVIIRPEADGASTEIFIIVPSGINGARAIVHFNEKGEGVAEKIEPTSASGHKPTMRLDFENAEPILRAFAKALAGVGVRPKDESAAEGELKAQSRHLDDLRKLLKLTK